MSPSSVGAGEQPGLQGLPMRDRALPPPIGSVRVAVLPYRARYRWSWTSVVPMAQRTRESRRAGDAAIRLSMDRCRGSVRHERVTKRDQPDRQGRARRPRAAEQPPPSLLLRQVRDAPGRRVRRPRPGTVCGIERLLRERDRDVRVFLATRGEGDAPKLRRLDVARMVAEPAAPVPWRLEPIVADGVLSMLYAPPGDGEKPVRRERCCRSGERRAHCWTRHSTRQGRLHVDAENGEWEIHRRVRSLGLPAGGRRSRLRSRQRFRPTARRRRAVTASSG